MKITVPIVEDTINDLNALLEYYEQQEDYITASTLRDAVECLEALKPYAD